MIWLAALIRVIKGGAFSGKVSEKLIFLVGNYNIFGGSSIKGV
jgi:hypothetical protein